MGRNSNPASGSSLSFNQGHPEEQERAIERSGQMCRVVQARKCSCITSGKPKLFCPLCHSKGWRFSYQKEYEVIEEISRHKSLGKTRAEIYPWWYPLTRVMKVFRHLSPVQGGAVSYPVLGFTDKVITVNTTGHPLENYFQTKVSYAYKLPVPVLNENSEHDGSYTIKTKGTKWVDKVNVGASNPFETHADLYSVSRVRNVTLDRQYVVVSFAKRSIYLKNVDAGNAPIPAPLSTDILEVDYEYFPLVKIALGRVEYENSIQKWGADIKEGDIEGLLFGGYIIGKGDIVTLMVSLLKGQEVIIRGSGQIDEIPQFDVYDIFENIEDEDGNIFVQGTHFELRNYNDLYWKTGMGPSAGKKYSLMFRYHPSYTVFKKAVSLTSMGNKVYPQNIFLRMFNKLDMKDIGVSTI